MQLSQLSNSVKWRTRILSLLLTLVFGALCCYALGQFVSRQQEGYMQAVTLTELAKMEKMPAYVQIEGAKAASGLRHTWVSEFKGKKHLHSFYPVFEADEAEFIAFQALSEAKSVLEPKPDVDSLQAMEKLHEAELNYLGRTEVAFVVDGPIGQYDCHTALRNLQKAFAEHPKGNQMELIEAYEQCSTSFSGKIEAISADDPLRTQLTDLGFRLTADARLISVSAEPPNVYFIGGYFLLTLVLTCIFGWMCIRSWRR
jgi:hypothetical protein